MNTTSWDAPMKSKQTLLLPIVLILMIITGCNNKKVFVESPTEGAVFNVAPEFRVAFEGFDGRSLTFNLNDTDITPHFKLNTLTSRATASSDAFLDAFKEGEND